VYHLVKLPRIPRAAMCPCSSSGMNRRQEEVLFPKNLNQLKIEIGFLKRNLNNLLLNFKDPFVLKID
jgi:hypothetical protein